MLGLDQALRLTEVLLAFALLQQSMEHMVGPRAQRLLFAPRLVLSLALLAGVMVPVALIALVLHSLLLLRCFNGPYNGGSDKMGMLILFCLCAAVCLPNGPAQEAAFGYLGAQVVLSYVVSGWVKITHSDWRSGAALRDVFDYSAYPVSGQLQSLAHWPRLMWAASWAVIVFELAFPLAFLSEEVMIALLVLAVLFHLANAMLFGLNRFVWVWVASYPAFIWLQGRVSEQF